MLMVTLSVDTQAGRVKGKRHTPSAESSQSNKHHSAEFAASHKPAIDIYPTKNGLVKVTVTTHLKGNPDHYIKSHSILTNNKSRLVKTNFTLNSDQYRSSDTLQKTSGQYYIESVCNTHGRWLESMILE